MQFYLFSFYVWLDYSDSHLHVTNPPDVQHSCAHSKTNKQDTHTNKQNQHAETHIRGGRKLWTLNTQSGGVESKRFWLSSALYNVKTDWSKGTH